MKGWGVEPKMTMGKIEKSLIGAVSDNREILQFEKDLISKYVQFGIIWDALSAEIKENGAMIDVINGSNVFRKVNPAVQEKQKISASMTSILRILGVDAKGLADNKSLINDSGGGLRDRKRVRD